MKQPQGMWAGCSRHDASPEDWEVVFIGFQGSIVVLPRVRVFLQDSTVGRHELGGCVGASRAAQAQQELEPVGGWGTATAFFAAEWRLSAECGELRMMKGQWYGQRIGCSLGCGLGWCWWAICRGTGCCLYTAYTQLIHRAAMATRHSVMIAP